MSQKRHCDACDCVIEGALMPSAALVAIPGFTGNVTVEGRFYTGMQSGVADLCRKCEVLIAESFIQEMQK